jgi:hypothetical protein
MAEWFTEDHLWALMQRYGHENPEEKAIEEACERSSEVRKLWATRGEPIWTNRQEEFARLLWPRVFRVLGITEDTPAGEPAAAISISRRGRQKGKVSIYEANLAAGIYVRDRAEYDAREDGGAYAVHKLYIEDREPGPTLLSRPMIGHLLAAMRAGWLPWDARKELLRISDEFRTSKSTFVIPRREPAS